MATNPSQYSQLSDFSSTGAQYQPYPYNSAAYAKDQYPSASLPQAQVQNFIQSPPAPPGGQPANQPRFGQRTVARAGGRRRKQQTPPGPIVARNGAKAVVPLYSYQTLKNNTVVQVPIFWTALNIALGYQVQGDQVIRGLPCIKRLRQLFCTNAGSQYPTDQIESFINENKALTRRMFGMYPPPSPHFATEVAPTPEMEPFETVEFATEFPFDQGFPGESLAALEVIEAPSAISSGGRGGEIDRGRAGRSSGESVRGRVGGRSTGRDGGGRSGGSSRNERKSARGRGVETVVETPPVRGSTENPPLRERTTTRGAGKGRHDVVDSGEFWETGTGESWELGLEGEEPEQNFLSVDVNNATAAVDAVASAGKNTNSTSSTSSNSKDLTGSSNITRNNTNTVQTGTEPEQPPFFDETGPSGIEPAEYIESTVSERRQRSGGRRSFARRRDTLQDRRGSGERRGFANERRKSRLRGAPREISRRLTDTLSDTGPSAWSARSARDRPRRLRHSFPAEPRPPANQVPPPADAKSPQPISVAPEAAAQPAPPTKAGGAYVALKVKGCSVMAPSVNRPKKHKLPVTAVPRASEHPPDQQFPRRNKRSVDNSTSPVAPSEARREKRQAVPSPPVIDKGSKHLVDSCESKVEIVTPYWAANSAGDIRAIVNTKHFPQAIHQEICKGTTTSRCTGNCLCEQKYTYHRLLSYDPDNNCKGIFIDWFLFPSCCACRCPP